MAAAMLLSVIIGGITFRLRGPYFVLASIAVAEIIRLATLHFKDFTNGAEGFLLSEIPPLTSSGGRSSSSRSALLLRRARPRGGDHPRELGWSSTRSSATTSRPSARTRTPPTPSASTSPSTRTWPSPSRRPSPPRRAGSSRCTWFIDPNIAFGLDVSVQIVLICIIGGIGTILGPVVGAMVLVPLSEVLRNPRGLVQVGIVSADSAVVRFIETTSRTPTSSSTASWWSW